jgi:hypothetical protein
MTAYIAFYQYFHGVQHILFVLCPRHKAYSRDV